MSDKEKTKLITEKRILQYSLTAAAVLAGSNSVDAQIQTQSIGQTLSNDGDYYDVQFNGANKFRISLAKADHMTGTPGSSGWRTGSFTSTTHSTTTTTTTKHSTTSLGAHTNTQTNIHHKIHTNTFTSSGWMTGSFPGSTWTVRDRTIRINNDTANAGAIYSRLNASTAIGNTTQIFNAQNMLARSFSSHGGSRSGEFLGQTDKFIGVKFTDGGSTHYGWIKVTVPGDASSIDIISAAYEQTANVPISSGALPVELTSFTGALVRNSISLKWNTATEVKNYGFDVEMKAVSNQQSAAGSEQWVKVGFVKGSGTSNSPKDYAFTDTRRPSGTYQYRLKQIDLDGSFQYSKVVELSVAAPKEFAFAQNYPNPFNPTTSIDYDVPASVMVSLKVYNALGQEVMTLVNEMKEAGSYTAHFDAGNLSTGQYFAKVTVGDITKTIKMTLLK